MKTFVFAITSFLAILLVSAVVVILTGAMDHHFGYLGSIVKTIIPSVVATLVLTIAFRLASIRFKGQRTRRNLAITGGLAGAVSHILAWVLSGPLQDIHMLAILLPYAVIGVFSSVPGNPRNG
jgi:hypothetical protein